MNKTILSFLLLLTLVFSGCYDKKHFITDSRYRKQVNDRFELRKKLAAHRSAGLFDIFNRDIGNEKAEALKFLYAYMPINDLADNDGDYFLEQVNLSFEARETFSWCKDLPEDIFRHFVLPVRVNNEDLDSSRRVFFKELTPRVKDLSMEDAALEVNHWCHEKVNYRSSDGRTSSPLASVRTSWGRCGEESTFTVAAMRSVGIPARQVYTPRWAHTDDNHAWVEVYVDGKWQYLGACEPEAVLNKGWFDMPVKRAMMVHTNVIGDYSGSESVISKTDYFTKINSLPAYTLTKQIVVKVQDKDSKPVNKAKVEFKIYNYAEFYPMVVKETDDKGFTDLITGLGDLQIWASKDGYYGYSNVSVGNSDTVLISLTRQKGAEYVEVVDNIPPVEKSIEQVTIEKQEENNRRLAYEDSLRNQYVSTFMQPADALRLAQAIGLDSSLVKKYISLSWGNWREISNFLKANKDHDYVLDILSSVSEKDIRDTPAAYLTDHLLSTANSGNYDRETYVNTILSPRIQNELIRPWRSYLNSRFNEDFRNSARKDISVITRWINDSIMISTTENYMGCPISPKGVYDIRIADKRSRNIFFVALCRTFGIPARIDIATSNPEVLVNNNWQTIVFESQDAPVKSATLTLNSNIENQIKPVYSIHYTLQKYNDGRFTTLDYEENNELNEFPAKISLVPGYYLLLTGNRRNDGSVLTRSEYFNVKDGEEITKTIILEQFAKNTEIAGIIELNTDVIDIDGIKLNLKDIAKDKGIIIAFINPANEPTRHVMSDIPQLKTDFDKWGGRFMFVVPENIVQNKFSKSMYNNLPDNSSFVIDNNKLFPLIYNSTANKTEPQLPYVLYINQDGEITYSSAGYRIGISEGLLKAVRKL